MDIFGKGPAFPFKRTGGGNFIIASGEELVDMGFDQAIRTGIGQRPMLKNKGNESIKMLFSLEGIARDVVAKEYIRKAIDGVEPRVVVDDVKVKDGEDKTEIYIHLWYKYIGSNVPQNKVVGPVSSGGA